MEFHLGNLPSPLENGCGSVTHMAVNFVTVVLLGSPTPCWTLHLSFVWPSLTLSNFGWFFFSV